MIALYIIMAIIFAADFVLYFVFLSKGNRPGQDVCITTMFVLACAAVVLLFRGVA